MAEAGDDQQEPDEGVLIQLNRLQVRVVQRRVSGSDLLALAGSSPSSEDLYQVRPGGTDVRLATSDEIELLEGDTFFTAASHIIAG